MSIDDAPEDGTGDLDPAPVGTDFDLDLQRVGRTVDRAFDHQTRDHREVVESMSAHFESAGISSADAVVGAWFFILSFAE